MDNFDIEESDKEIQKIFSRFEETEKDGKRDILRYFDRIHDKLFSFNNMLIAGYFVLIAFPHSNVSPWWMLLPIFNMLYLIRIEYKMMEKSRFEASIMKKTQEEINKWGNGINRTTNNSLFTIFLTLIVSIVFIIQLIRL